jgi:plasmid maintenance system antidote protein VapI
MSFQNQLVHRIWTFRSQSNGVGIQKAFVENLVSQPAMIQPLSAEYAAKINEVFGRTYNLFLPLGCDVQIGDKVLDQDQKEYRVTASLKRNYGFNAHLTFIISEQVTATPDQ